MAFLGSGPLLYLAAYQYAKAGVNVAAVATTAPWAGLAANFAGMAAQPGTAAKGAAYIAKLRSWRIPIIAAVRPSRVLGSDSVTGIEVLADGRIRRFDCDAVALGYGLKSESQLAELAGAAFIFDRVQNQWLPETDAQGRAIGRDGLYLAGDGAGIQGRRCRRAARAGSRRERCSKTSVSLRKTRTISVGSGAGTVSASRWNRQCLSHRTWPRTCRTTPSSAAARTSPRARCGSPRIRACAKSTGSRPRTRLGMGRCQGRVCGIAGAEVLAAKLGVSVDSVGRLRGQPPVKPVPIDALAGDAP